MKKILFLLLLCTLYACTEGDRRGFRDAMRTLPNMKGHFKGYGQVWTYNKYESSAEYVGRYPVYRSGSRLKIYMDEDEDACYELEEIDLPEEYRNMNVRNIKYVFTDDYGQRFYVDGKISY